MDALVLVVAVIGYLFTAGTLGFATRLRLMKDCLVCQRKGYCAAGHQFAFPLLAGAAWPLAIPVVGGGALAHRLASSDDRAERREKQKQADHKRRMAELEAQRVMTMESVKFLVENGIQADVPGLFDSNGGKS